MKRCQGVRILKRRVASRCERTNARTCVGFECVCVLNVCVWGLGGEGYLPLCIHVGQRGKVRLFSFQ